MYNAGSAFETAAMRPIRKSIVKVIVGSDDVSADVLKVDFAHQYPSFLGGFSAKSVEITLKASAIPLTAIRDSQIKVDMGFAPDLLVPLGLFFADKESIELDEVTGFVKFIAYDATLQFDIPFDSSGIPWPVSHDYLVSYCCNKVGVAPHPDARLNNPILVDRDPWPDEVVSYRQVIATVVQANLAIARIDRTGLLNFTSVVDETESVVEITGNQIIKLTADRAQEPIDSVVIEDSDGEKTIPNAMMGLTAHNPITLKNAILDLDPQLHVEHLYGLINGFIYLPFEMDLFIRPDLDCLDLISITHKGETFSTHISSITMTWQGGLRGKLVNELPSEIGVNYELAGMHQTVYNTIKKVKSVDHKLQHYADSSAQLFDSLSLMLGVYPTVETLEDGSQIRYWHDQPTLQASQIIWKHTAAALAYSTDGGLTWGGLDALNDTITAMFLSVVGIDASWINAGSMSADRVVIGGSPITTKFSDLETSIDDLNRQQMEYKAGGSNLALNSDFGTVLSPSAMWWTIQNQTSWDLLKARFDTWNELKNRGVSWAGLKTYNW